MKAQSVPHSKQPATRLYKTRLLVLLNEKIRSLVWDPYKTHKINMDTVLEVLNINHLKPTGHVMHQQV